MLKEKKSGSQGDRHFKEQWKADHQIERCVDRGASYCIPFKKKVSRAHQGWGL